MYTQKDQIYVLYGLVITRVIRPCIKHTMLGHPTVELCSPPNYVRLKHTDVSGLHKVAFYSENNTQIT